MVYLQANTAGMKAHCGQPTKQQTKQIPTKPCTSHLPFPLLLLKPNEQSKQPVQTIHSTSEKHKPEKISSVQDHILEEQS